MMGGVMVGDGALGGVRRLVGCVGIGQAIR